MASANNAKKGANVRMKRKERKNIAAGQAHIQSTFNNTVVTITDLQGNAFFNNVHRNNKTVKILNILTEFFLDKRRRRGGL